MMIQLNIVNLGNETKANIALYIIDKIIITLNEKKCQSDILLIEPGAFHA